ncbi:MAG: Lrp/AsnC family transcriptional regulator, partial [Pseudomonadota bacterium]
MIDDIDRRLLRALQENARLTNAELAERAALSASACHRRVQRLEALGYIRDYVALLDAGMLERRTTVFVEISLSGQSDAVLADFEAAVAQVPDVLECHLMAGT